MSPKVLFQNGKAWLETPRGRLVKQTVIIPLILFSMFSAGRKLWTESNLQIDFVVWPLVIAIGLATLHRVVNAYGWTLVLRAMRFDVTGSAATRIWLLAESRRWLPGGVWGYASRATLAGQLGVGPVAAAASMFAELMMVCFAAAIVVLPGLAFHHAELADTIMQWVSFNMVAWVVAGGGAMSILAWKLRAKFMSKVQTLKSRYESLHAVQLSGRKAVVATVFFVFMNVLNGLVTYVMISLLPNVENVPLLAVLAASSAAWCVGFFAFFSPGGLLVREAALAALLMPWIPYTDGLALAVLARMAQLVAEGLAMTPVAVDIAAIRKKRLISEREARTNTAKPKGMEGAEPCSMQPTATA